MLTRTVSAFLLALTGSLGVVVACGSDPRAYEAETLPNEPGSSSGFGGDAAATKKDLACSGDLTTVIDKTTGIAVTTCPGDQGCAAGACVPACEAAKASKGSIGCDYVVATPSFYPTIAPPCFAIFLANNWSSPVKVEVARAGQTYDVSAFGRIATAGQPESAWPAVPKDGIPKGQVAVLFMSADPGSRNGETPLTCPVPTAVPSGTATAGTGRGQAWHLTTSAPVTAYDILPYGGARSFLPSAELLLPTTAWGTNYYGVVPPRGSSGPQWGQIVAATDGTTVQVLASVALPGGGGVSAAPKGATTSYTLNAGEVLQWQDTGEMSGTVLASDKPIAFVGGNGYDCYRSKTSQGGGCDSAHQQVFPVSALGSAYVGSAYATRRANGQPESIPYRLVAAVDGTSLAFDPAVPGAPLQVNAGQTFDFEATGSFVVKSQDDKHPFYLGQVMSGCTVSNGSLGGGCLGDEEYVNLVPPAQFLSRYVFFTDPTYKTTNLVVVRSKVSGAFQDVTLDCAGVLGGWRDVDAAGLYQQTEIDLVRDGQPNGTCNNGPHVAESKGPFGLMVWGLDEYASYAYPAGGNVAPINAVVVPAVPK
jgi:hypothetical protein